TQRISRLAQAQAVSTCHGEELSTLCPRRDQRPSQTNGAAIGIGRMAAPWPDIPPVQRGHGKIVPLDQTRGDDFAPCTNLVGGCRRATGRCTKFTPVECLSRSLRSLLRWRR